MQIDEESCNCTGFNGSLSILTPVSDPCSVIINNESLSYCGLQNAPILTNSTLVKIYILLLIGILSFVGNLGALISINKVLKRHARNVYRLLWNLCIADILVTIFCIFGEAFWFLSVDWKAGNVLCKLFKFAQLFSLYLSTVLMILIGLDRFITVKYPLKYVSKGVYWRVIIVCWIISAILSLPQIYVFHESRGPFKQVFFQCVSYGSLEPWQDKIYAIFSISTLFVTPLVIIASTYLMTVCTLRNNEEFFGISSKHLIHSINPTRRRLIRSAKKKSLRISIVIVTTFIVSWIPYYGLMIHSIFFVPDRDMGEEENDIKEAIFFFGMSNSFINPIIYGVFHLWKSRRDELQRSSSSPKLVVRFSNNNEKSNVSSPAVDQIIKTVDLNENSYTTTTNTNTITILSNGNGLGLGRIVKEEGHGRNKGQKGKGGVQKKKCCSILKKKQIDSFKAESFL